MRTSKVELRTVLQRLKDLTTRLNNPEQFSRYLIQSKELSSGLDRLGGLFSLPGKSKEDGLFIFGHFDELHDRISGEAGSFAETLKKLDELSQERPKQALKIGVTRHNFFCLGEIVDFCLIRKGIKPGLGLGNFSVIPLDRVIEDFFVYVSEIIKKTEGFGIDFVLYDKGLLDILRIVNFHGQRKLISEKELVRLLGVITEHAFIGPQTIVLDPHHICNIKCKHCFVHNPLIKHTDEFLNRKFDFEKFKSVIDDASDLKVDGVILQGDGEPLLYNKFFDMLRYARKKDIGVSFFTNGTLIFEKEAREIIDLEIREIYCSVPAGTSETYAQVTTSCGKEIFSSIVDNLKTLVRIKKSRGQDAPRLTMTHVIHKLNYHELIEMANIDTQIGADAARFYLIRLEDNNRHLQLSPGELKAIKKELPAASRIFKKAKIDFIDNIMFQLNHYDNDTGAWSKNIFLREGCTIGWYFCLIPALYDVSLCCHLRTVGDLTKQSFKELWNSREYRRYRIQAKFLSDNKDVTFSNNVKLYDEHCEHCDNHQTLMTTFQNLKRMGLYAFLK